MSPMKNTLLTVLAGCACAFGFSGLPEGFKELAIGEAAPAFELPGTDGKTYTLESFSDADVLMLYFTGTHCPTSHGLESRLQQFVEQMKGESFQIVAINPNNDDGLTPDEYSYSHYTESFEDSKKYAEDLGWDFPFLYDGHEQIVARQYGCLATPHVFVFDKERHLRYQGRFDDSRFADPSTVNQRDAQNAVEALLAGKPVPVEKTRPFGCSTKWKEKKAWVEKDDERWAALPVSVEGVDLEGVKKLRQNGTHKVRLINVWSTSCVPCKAEMPDLAKVARRFSRRNFEIITLSLDEIGQQEKVERFLGKTRMVMSDTLKKSVLKEGRQTNNYIYEDASIDALAEVLDPSWEGPIPFSLLLDPQGNVLFKRQGIVHEDELKDAALEYLKTTW